jgi:hypothetical protein
MIYVLCALLAHISVDAVPLNFAGHEKLLGGSPRFEEEKLLCADDT